MLQYYPPISHSSTHDIELMPAVVFIWFSVKEMLGFDERQRKGQNSQGSGFGSEAKGQSRNASASCHGLS